jgi:hypothetical protein
VFTGAHVTGPIWPSNRLAVRQWLLLLPKRLRWHLHRDPVLMTAVLRVFLRAMKQTLGPAYGIETCLDQSLTSLAHVYFEAGDHEQLVHMAGDAFRALPGVCDRATTVMIIER